MGDRPPGRAARPRVAALRAAVVVARAVLLVARAAVLVACVAAPLALASTPARAAAGASRPDAAPAPRAAAPGAEAAPPRAAQRLDRAFSVARFGLAGAGLGFLLWDTRRRRHGAPGGRGRRAAWLVLGVAGYASYYYFFQFSHYAGFDNRDGFHYYVGSKYFPELGHYGLYDCTLLALREAGHAPAPLRGVRDLHTLQVGTVPEALARGARCRAAFTPERWARFREDVSWFRDRTPDAHWAQVMLDHGYHPSPVWTAFGNLAANAAPTGSLALRVLFRADRVVVAATLVAVALAFGLRTGALAALVWGTGYLWSYSWIGDSFLRHLWFASALGGIALLARRRHAAAGALLATAALLRIFPGAFGLAWLLHAGREAWRTRAIAPRMRRFALGAALAAVLGLGAGAVVGGRGPGVYAEFAAKIGALSAAPGLNKVGLGEGVDDWVRHRAAATARGRGGVSPVTLSAWLRPASWGVMALALGLFARALRGLEDWEAAALGFAWIPVFMSPTNYYYSFVVAGALLAKRRPRIGAWLLAASLAWTAFGLVFYLTEGAFMAASAVAVAASLAILWEAGNPAPAPPSGPPRARSGRS
jgi:hypothetical protein